jgi:hypothetical protein
VFGRCELSLVRKDGGKCHVLGQLQADKRGAGVLVFGRCELWLVQKGQRRVPRTMAIASEKDGEASEEAEKDLLVVVSTE